MKEKYKISVVVPVHNTGKFLLECLNSLCNQTIFSQLEIICIDSSTDESTEIIETYEKKYPNIILIRDDNSSYGYKINKGISVAQGKYFGIVDSDDSIESNMYEYLYDCIQKYNVDFVKSDYSCFINENQQNKIVDYINNLGDLSLYGKVLNCSVCPDILYSKGVSIWTGLYSLSFLRQKNIKLHESEGASFQDTGFGIFTHVFARKFYYIQKSFYRYRIDNPNSSVKSNKKYNLIKYEMEFVSKELEKYNVKNIDILNAVKIDKLRTYYWNYNRLEKNTAEKFLEEIHEEVYEDFFTSGLYFRLSENFIDILDILLNRRKNLEDNLSNSEIILVSAGKLGKKMLSYAKTKGFNSIKYVMDNNAKEIIVDGINIKVNSIQKMDGKYIYLIMNAKNSEVLYNQLLDIGISKDNILVFRNFPFGAGI